MFAFCIKHIELILFVNDSNEGLLYIYLGTRTQIQLFLCFRRHFLGSTILHNGLDRRYQAWFESFTSHFVSKIEYCSCHYIFFQAIYFLKISEPTLYYKYKCFKNNFENEDMKMCPINPIISSCNTLWAVHTQLLIVFGLS